MPASDGDLGDPRFTALYRQAYRQIFAAVLLATKDAQLAEDLTQEAFLDLLKRDDKRWLDLQYGEQVALLRVIALRRSIDHFRRGSRFFNVIQRAGSWTKSGSFTDVEAEAMTRDIVRAITDIPQPKERAVAMMAWLDDKSATQIAADLDIPASTVRGILHRLRERFRSMFVEVETEPGRQPEGAS
jgi:RNA polymerase sigma factor (sigma-70 family)